MPLPCMNLRVLCEQLWSLSLSRSKADIDRPLLRAWSVGGVCTAKRYLEGKECPSAVSQ